MKIICDLRSIQSEDEITDSGLIQKIDSALRDRIGKLVIVEIHVKRIKPDKGGKQG